MPRAPKNQTSQKCAHIKKDGTQCRRWVTRGASRCRSHGGSNQFQRGALNPNFKTGRYSNCPTALSERIQDAENDPRLLEQREEIALLAVRIQQLLDSLPSAGSDDSEVWAEIRKTILDKDSVTRSERKHMLHLQQFISAEDLTSMLVGLATVIRENTTDQKLLHAVGREFQRYM